MCDAQYVPAPLRKGRKFDRVDHWKWRFWSIRLKRDRLLYQALSILPAAVHEAEATRQSVTTRPQRGLEIHT